VIDLEGKLLNKEIEIKITAIRNLYKSFGKTSILIEKQYNLSWLFKWKTHVNFASINGFVDVIVTEDGLYLIANNVEAPRIIQEERFVDITLCEYFWYEPEMRNQLINEITGGNHLVDGNVENEIRAIRSTLTNSEIADFSKLCMDSGLIMQETCMQLKQGSSEFVAASMIAQKCLEREIEPVILLVAADERIQKFRHPLPTSNPINDYVMLVMGVRREGQYSCLTRFVAFSEPSDEIKKRRDAVLRLTGMLLSDTRPGVDTAQLFRALVKGYENEGFPNEWKLHHQGGLGGYNSREYKASPTVSIPVKAGQIYVWNPSITGYKAEDTMVVTEKENKILTVTPELPTVDIDCYGKIVRQADIIVRKNIH